jgi:hypothetical protein
MDAGAIVIMLSKALTHLRAGEHRRARACLAPLGADVLPAPPLPRAAWITKLIALDRVDEAEAEIEALLAQAQSNTFAHASTSALLQTALGIYGEAGLAAANVASPHEIAGLTRPGAALGPNEALLRQRLLVLLSVARAA